MMTAEPPSYGPPPLRGRARVVRDLAIRLVGIPFFGLVIPRVMGLLPPGGWRTGIYWWGSGWFLLLSFVLWQGNRWLLFRRRARPDWLAEPAHHLVSLLLAHIALTAAVTAGALLFWGQVAPAGLEASRLLATTGLVVAAVLLVAHAYETTFLIQDRLEDRLHLEQVTRARLQADLNAMKVQLTPHFLFNCLNALAVLIQDDPVMARRYNQQMAELCRYLIVHQHHDLVPLEEERAFFEAYGELARLRFPAGLELRLVGFDPRGTRGFLIPPASLQLLLENALKHNDFSDGNPLRVEVLLSGETVTVTNPCRPLPAADFSTGMGLMNLRERFQLAAGRTVQVSEVGGVFQVVLPLVRG